MNVEVSSFCPGVLVQGASAESILGGDSMFGKFTKMPRNNAGVRIEYSVVSCVSSFFMVDSSLIFTMAYVYIKFGQRRTFL